ncbi:hypothetical protein A3L09_07655 [Thermococcus profundus]|uniref:Glycosyltransferase RgtA/B/C/D-like domain-containing protein n=1 Tax=Thermococcus profundus TaxID=49899 RepID=A0A2Z2MEP8_THEPR|nr:hypothetical protein [Thermococcus profundus]ASJ03135.1 hypothetical protein A3L09_07655 [Thermococcus profundus]
MKERRTKALNVVLALSVVVISKLEPHLTLLLPCYLGFMLVRNIKDLDSISKFSISPAVGLGVTIFLIHILSWLRLSLRLAYPILAFLVIVISLLVHPVKVRRDVSIFAISGVGISLLLSFGIKIPFFEVPTYPAGVSRPDAVFHAYKSLEILMENTLFIKNVPSGFDDIIAYPSGYHSIVAFLSGATGITVAKAMLILKIYTWIFIPLGTYAAAWSVFKDTKIAVFSSILAPISSLYYYYLNYSLFHQFLNYYMFLAAVSLYNMTIETPERRNILLSLVVISAVLMIHPYVYLAFVAYATFVVLLTSLKRKKIDTRVLEISILQVVGSFLAYYTLEYPIRVNPMRHVAFFNASQYAFKDSISWVAGILKYTFFDEWQVILGLFFVVGMIYGIKHGTYSLQALIATVFYLLFLVFNKIAFHIPIPFYSGIWSSERVYVLITPIIPIIGGTGLYFTLKYIERLFMHPKIVMVSLALLLILPAFYVNLWNFSFEMATEITSDTIKAYEFIEQTDPETIVVPKFYDSGTWIKVYLPEKNLIMVENMSEIQEYKDGILYVDSRGYGDIRINPINPWEIAQKYQVIYFNDNIWIFNLSNRSDKVGMYPLSLYQYYTINKDEIQASNINDWRYLSYGFLLRHPVIIHGIKFEKWDIVLTRSKRAVIAVVPNRDYVGIGVELYPQGNQIIEVFINGNLVGEIREGGYWRFECPLKKGNLYIIELEGDPGYAFIRMKLEGGT